MAARIAAVLGVLLAGTALSAPAAGALTRTQANAAALAALKPDKVASPTGVVVYGGERPIRAGHAVWADAVPRRAKQRYVTARVRPLKHDAWLFWMDPTWGAKFSHPSTMLLVDDKTGAVRRRQLDYWPIVDGKEPPFVTWGRFQARFQVFSNVPGGSTGQPLGGVGKSPTASLTRAVPGPIQVPKDALKGDCIITIGEGSDVKAKADFAAVSKLAGDLKAAGTGLQQWKASSGKQYDDPDGDNLASNVRWAVGDPQNCKDVMLFIDGHGTKEGDGPPSVYVGRKNWEKTGKNADGTDKWKSDPAMVTAEDLQKILDEFKTTTFKIKIDACYSGRIKNALPKKKYPNIHILEASSSATETSYFYLKDVKKADGSVVPSSTDNPGNAGKPGLSEFTNGNISALRDFFTSSTLIKNAQDAGGALLAQALTYAARSGGAQDFAQQNGMTHPSFYTDQILEPPGGPRPTGATQTLGSTLQPLADTPRNSPEDEDFWPVFFRYCELHPADPLCVHGTTTQGRYVDPSGQGTMPADGQIVAIRVKGMALGSTVDGAPPPLTEIHFSALRPQPDGSVQVIVSSQAFNLPASGDPNQVTTYVPENFCVKAGDYLTLSTEGGFDSTYFPQGVRYEIFGNVPGSKVAYYSKHNGVMNGAQFTGAPVSDTELLMQWDLATGDHATALCPGGTKS